MTCRMQEKKTDMRKNHMTHDMPRTKIVSAGVSCFSWNSLGVRNLGALKFLSFSFPQLKSSF